MIFKWALRELLNNKKFAIIFVANLSIGLAGFVTLQAFKDSISNSVNLRSKSYLGADLAISARRDLTPKEVKEVESTLAESGETYEVSYMRELYSMAASSSVSRLVNLRIIDESYPFYGHLEMGDGREIKGGELGTLHQNPSVWVYPEILVQLDVKVGEKIRIGETEFLISDVINYDTGNTMTGGALAPRIYISEKHFASTGLISKGSTIWYSRLFKFSGQDREHQFKKAFTDKLDDPGLRIYTHQSAAQRTSRVIGYLNDYLGLSSLVALFLAAIGAAYIFRNYLNQRIKDIAIFISLGLNPKQARQIYLSQVLILGALSALPAIVISFMLLPLFGHLSADILPFDMEFNFTFQVGVIAFLIGSLGSVFICLPLMSRLKNLNVQALFQENSQPRIVFELKAMLWFLPFLIFYYGLAVWQSNSWIIGSLFFAAFFVAGLLSMGAGYVLVRTLNRVKWSQFSTRFSVQWMSRSLVSTLTCFIAIALGVLLLNLIFIIESGLTKEVDRPMGVKLPNLFLFDIQDEQVDELKGFVQESSTNLDQLSPLVRARIIKVNGEAFERRLSDLAGLRTREQERARRSRNRGYNLSYRQGFSESEKLVKGKQFSGPYDEAKQAVPFVSVEIDFARRLGWSLGDRLTFDVQGVEIEGEILNFRSVNWASFQPNFFIQFQPGVLEEAPKSFVASVSDLSKSQVMNLQNEIVKRFPNISLIDVSRVVKRVLEIATTISWALKLMAGLCLFVALVVLYSIARNQVRLRKVELNLLKVLGSSFTQIQKVQMTEFASIGVLATTAGILASTALTYGLSLVLFNGIFSYPWLNSLMLFFGVPALCLLVGYFALGQSLKESAAQALYDEN